MVINIWPPGRSRAQKSFKGRRQTVDQVFDILPYGRIVNAVSQGMRVTDRDGARDYLVAQTVAGHVTPARAWIAGDWKAADPQGTAATLLDRLPADGSHQEIRTAILGHIAYLAIRAPDTRIITGAFSDTILQGRERESLLSVANDLLDVLAIAASEAPLRALTLENTFRPAQVLGSIIGGVIGFFLGGFIGVLLLFLLKDKHLFLIPVLALGGAALGRFIGNTLTRVR